MLKSAGKRLICRLLEWQVRRLRARHHFKVVAVAGSMGKTSTKLAVAHALRQAGQRVRFQSGNYNDRLTVPLVLFEQTLPGLFNVYAWMRILLSNERMLRTAYPYDVAVLELGTDAPGQMQRFAYLAPDLLVLTAVAAEHMEQFVSMAAVAAEETCILPYAKHVLVNTDDVAAEYLPEHFMSYGLVDKAKGYFAQSKNEDLNGQTLELFKGGKKYLTCKVKFLGAQGRKIALAAAAVAGELGVPAEKVKQALPRLEPFAGRMQVLRGVKDSRLIDDTYNATPAAVEAALRVLESAPTPQRIAVLGSMNELGNFSEQAHKAIGASIDPAKVELVITIGQEAREYLAPAAAEAGCKVESFQGPVDAGEYVKRHLKAGAVVLFKGSQNGVFAEEAIKPLLANLADTAKLVRQSDQWLKNKDYSKGRHLAAKPA